MSCNLCEIEMVKRPFIQSITRLKSWPRCWLHAVCLCVLCGLGRFERYDVTRTPGSVANSQYWNISLRPHFVTILFLFRIFSVFILSYAKWAIPEKKDQHVMWWFTCVNIFGCSATYVCAHQYQNVRRMDCTNRYKIWPLLAFYLSLRAFPWYFSATTVA